MSMDEPERQLRRWARRLADRKARARSLGHDFAARLAYDGRAFAGYARQPGRPTVEASLRRALSAHVPGLRRVAVAGRTDRGVSASGQVVSFRSDEPLLDLDRLSAAIDGEAPGQLQCLAIAPQPRGFHAQFWAHERRYAYHLPCSEDLHWAHADALDALLRPLEGKRSFAAFTREFPEGRSTVRTLLQARCQPGHLDDQPVLRFELRANGFLRKMVRVLVATAIRACREDAPPRALLDLAETEDRTQTAAPARPEPLVLTAVVYGAGAPASPPSSSART